MIEDTASGPFRPLRLLHFAEREQAFERETQWTTILRGYPLQSLNDFVISALRDEPLGRMLQPQNGYP